MSDVAPVVEMTGISIAFPPVQALDAVDFRLYPGEVCSLMGENGAGKSTLIKALTGVYPIDAGQILVAGRQVSFSGPGAGAGSRHQHRLPGSQPAPQPHRGREHHARSGAPGLGRDRRSSDASTRPRAAPWPEPRHRPGVAAGLALAGRAAARVDRPRDRHPAKVLVLDEPTSSLDADEVEELFRVIRSLKESGVAILFVSHFLDQVYEISDRLTVLRNGRLVGDYRTDELLRIELVHKMIGKEMAVLDQIERRTQSADADEELTPYVQAVGLGRKGSIEPIDLTIYEGEVVGLAGLLGSGRTELGRMLSGVDRSDTGTLAVHGRARRFRSPRAALKQRVAYSSENRRAEGHRRRPHHPRQHRAGSAVGPWLAPPDPSPTPGRAGRQLHRRAEHPTRQPGRPGPQPLRRQPAEGAAGALAGHRTTPADPGRTDPWHRHRRQGRDPEAGRRPGRQRHVGAVHLRRARGGPAAEPPGGGAAGPPQGGGPRQRRISASPISCPSSPTAAQPRR